MSALSRFFRHGASSESAPVDDGPAPLSEPPTAGDDTGAGHEPNPLDPAPPLPPEAERLRTENEQLRARLYSDRRTNALGKVAGMTALADPEDVFRFVPEADLLDEDGLPDVDRIAVAAADLVAARPYLRRQSFGSGDGGARGGNGGQLTRADLATMSTEQIVQAKQTGRLDHLLGRAR